MYPLRIVAFIGIFLKREICFEIEKFWLISKTFFYESRYLSRKKLIDAISVIPPNLRKRFKTLFACTKDGTRTI